MRVEDKRDIRNKPLKRIRLLFILLFTVLAFNLVYFALVRSPRLVINDYNPRLEAIEASVIRGDIIDRKGRLLAYSTVSGGNQTRQYPYAGAFAHSIGYIGVGKTGLEGYSNLSLIQSSNSFGDQLQESLSMELPKGNTMITTFDAELQQLALELLGENKGAIVALDPSTGEVLAMVSTPVFNPNTLEADYGLLIANELEAPLLNRATQGLYPPGSTYKTITTIAYLEEYPESDFFNYCEGQSFVGQKVIHCYDGTAHGRVTLEEAFALSCNTSYAKMGESLSVERLGAISDQFLFNTPITMEIPTATSQFVLNAESSPNERVETVIGQGKTLVTPLNNALIACAVANGGQIYKPHLVSGERSAEGQLIEEVKPEIMSNIMTPAMAETLERYMKSTSEIGTARALLNDQYTVASKTGSAENSQGPAHAWYIGYAPVENPQIALAIVVENVGSSSVNAVPIAKELYDYWLVGSAD